MENEKRESEVESDGREDERRERIRAIHGCLISGCLAQHFYACCLNHFAIVFSSAQSTCNTDTSDSNWVASILHSNS